MEKIKKQDSSVHYQTPTHTTTIGWRLQRKHMETPKGVSMTVPDDSYTIKDLIRKFGNNLDPSITKLSHFNGEDDEVSHDDIDFSEASRGDLHEVELLQNELAQRAELAQQKLKKPSPSNDKKDEKNTGIESDATSDKEQKIPVKVESKKQEKLDKNETD